MTIRHIDPSTRDAATAPYNFVPLPRRIYTVEGGLEAGGKTLRTWQMHDQFVPGTHQGWLDVKIEAVTPLFIRGPARKTEGAWDDQPARERPEPFLGTDGRPVIPGSSLRGMIRTLVEILAFSKIQPVTDQKPFFRTVGNDRLGLSYRGRMIQGDQKPAGGFLRILPDRREIIPAEVYRVRGDLVPGLEALYRDKPDYTPPWSYQQRRCIVQFGVSGRISGIRVQDRPLPGWTPGTLVLSGGVRGKLSEFVLMDPRQGEPAVRIPDGIWQRFHDDDQITQWQEKAFPQDEPAPRCRAADGHLRDGEPVFFLRDDRLTQQPDNPDGLVFLGRPQMFRLPYDRSPRDLAPEELRNAGLDLAEALFGRVSPGKAGLDQAIKGRLRFEEATATGPDRDWLDPECSVVLASPKATAYPHYLTQDGTRGKEHLTTYLEGDRTAIRGHKLYWHRGRTPGSGTDEKIKETQKSKMRPVKKGTQFAGRIWFENLTDVELGALLAAVRLPQGCAHKLGQGKPLGFGSIHIEAEVTLIDPSRRYASWEATGVRSEGERESILQQCWNRFETEMLRHAKESGEASVPGGTGLRAIARLDAMFLLLAWDKLLPAFTEPLALAEFKDKRVLPTTHAVFYEAQGVPPPEIAWPGDAPQPGDAPRAERPRGQRPTDRPGGRSGDRPGRPARPSQPTGFRPPRPDLAAPSRPSAPDPIADLKRQVEWFDQRRRGNLAMLVGKFEAAPPTPERSVLAQSAVRRAESFSPRLSPTEVALVQRLRDLFE